MLSEFSKLSPQAKVGFFVFLALLVLVYSTIRISQTSFFPGSTYAVYVDIDSAAGIDEKTPVRIAGIQVGIVNHVRLIENNRARLELKIKRRVKLSPGVEVRIRSVGFMGDTYIELYQPQAFAEPLPDKSVISKVTNYGDFNSVTGQISAIAEDVKAITATLRTLMAGDESVFARSLVNIEKITTALEHVTTRNEENLNSILSNLRVLSENLAGMAQRNRFNVDSTLENMSEITGKVNRGEGTIGRLVNDEETVEKVNESLDNLNSLLGTAGRMKVELGYHGEYLGGTKDIKNYVSLALKPKPDKYFLFELVNDPSPSPTHSTKKTEVTSGGVTTTVKEKVEKTNPDKFRFSAEFAKKFYDLTLRGGIIESTGGVGLDYDFGPVGVKFSAFDFGTSNDERPHLKAMGTVNITKSLYLLGGVDDFINKNQPVDWFMGAGFKMTDDDIKSLIGLTNFRR